MVIDSSIVVNNPHDGEFRVKKREDAEKIKPVEDAGNSDEPELNIEKDKITEKSHEKRYFDTGDIYNKNGEIDQEWKRDENKEMKAQTIDLLV